MLQQQNVLRMLHLLYLLPILYILWIKCKALLYRPLIFPATPFWIKIGGLALYFGFNVAFPTETVYGLGASIWSLDAVHGIFEKKRRPITNPLIVHVPSYEDVFEHDLTRMTQNERVLFKVLTYAFWPGPITFVVRANTDKIDPIIRNNTPFVGLRAPDNITALALLRVAGVPIAAPSANRYTKISPTSAPHVYNDYNGLGIFMPILDERNSKENVGIESTIVMLQEKGGVVYVTILRSGAIGSKDLTDALVCMCDIPYVVVAKSNDVNGSTSVAPGQERLHYSPANAETFRATTTPTTTTPLNYSKSVLIATYNVVGGHGRKYQKCFTLPSTAKDCASVLYNVMREADAYCKKSNAVNIVICTEGIQGEEGCGFMDAIEDKVARASAGKEAIEV